MNNDKIVKYLYIIITSRKIIFFITFIVYFKYIVVLKKEMTEKERERDIYCIYIRVGEGGWRE